MKYNKIERCRFSKARRYLLELTRAYGLKHIEVIKKGDSEPQQVLVRTYVIMEFGKLKIPFDEDMSRKENWKPRHRNLSVKQMTVLVLRGFIELKKGYIEDFTPEFVRDLERIEMIKKSLRADKKYLKTFSEYDNDTLTPFSTTRIFTDPMTDERMEKINECKKWIRSLKLSVVTISGVNQVFWTLSYAGMNITQNMRDALISLTDNQEIRDYIDYCCDKYDFDVTKHIRNKKVKNQEVIELSEKLVKKKTEVETLKLKCKEKTESIKEKNKEIERLKRDLSKSYQAKYEKKVKLHFSYKGTIKYLLEGLISPNSKISRAYNLNNEEDIVLFLKWFEYSGKTIPNNTIKYIAKYQITDENSLERFKELVNEMNERVRQTRNNNLITDLNSV